MTPESIRDHLLTAFKSIYPDHIVEILGAGTEVISADVWADAHCRDGDAVTWSSELDSDNDGAFWFTHGDLTLKIPYPE